jgi:hypothetical protein
MHLTLRPCAMSMMAFMLELRISHRILPFSPDANPPLVLRIALSLQKNSVSTTYHSA